MADIDAGRFGETPADLVARLGTGTLGPAQAAAEMALGELSRCLRGMAVACAGWDDACVREAVLEVAGQVGVLGERMEDTAGALLADGVEGAILQTPREELAEREGCTREQAHGFLRLRDLLASTGRCLRVEAERVCRDFSRHAEQPRVPTTGVVAARELRAAATHAVRTLCSAFWRDDEVPLTASAEPILRSAASERLRREIWMFAVVARCFGDKVDAGYAAGQEWSGGSALHLAADFGRLYYFLGEQLVRRSDYERGAALAAAISALDAAAGDVESALARAAAECRPLVAYLDDLFARVSQRAELRGARFDDVAAGETLRVHLEMEREARCYELPV